MLTSELKVITTCCGDYMADSIHLVGRHYAKRLVNQPERPNPSSYKGVLQKNADVIRQREKLENAERSHLQQSFDRREASAVMFADAMHLQGF